MDRVLNGRPRVRESSIKLVHAGVEKLGYVRDVSADNLAKRREHHFAFTIPDSRSQFAETIHDVLDDGLTIPKRYER
jgi:LacI family transcriptional regulator